MVDLTVKVSVNTRDNTTEGKTLYPRLFFFVSVQELNDSTRSITNSRGFR